MFFFQTKLSILTTQIRLNMDLLCQDVFLYHYCLSLFQHQQLAIPAFDIGSAALHFFQSRRFTKKWSNCRTKACALHPLGLCEYTLVSRKKTYCQHLSYKLADDFSHFAICFKSRILDFRHVKFSALVPTSLFRLKFVGRLLLPCYLLLLFVFPTGVSLYSEQIVKFSWDMDSFAFMWHAVPI